MSKKMLKRSLALGALMAFVITGQALAADISYSYATERQELVNWDDPTGNTLTAADVVTHTINLNGNDIVIKSQDNTKGLYVNDVKQDDKYFNGFITFSDALSKTAEHKNVYAQINHGEVIGTGVETITLNGDGAGEAIKAQSAYSVTTISNVEVIKIEGEAANYIYAEGGATITLEDVTSIKGSTTGRVFQAANGAKIDVIGATEVNIEDSTRAVFGHEGGVVSLDAEESISLTSSSDNPTVEARNGGSVAITGNTIKITAEGDVADVTAVKADNRADNTSKYVKNLESKITIGTNGTDSIEITAKSEEGEAQGIWATKRGGDVDAKASIIEVKGNNLKVDVEGKINGNYVPVGVWAASNSMETPSDNVPMINIVTTNTTIDVKDTSGNNRAVAVMAMSKGIVNLNCGNVYATADEGNGDVILARGGAVVNVGANGKETVLKGNMNFNYNSHSSGSGIDATVNAIFDGAKSSFVGKIYKTNDDNTDIPVDKSVVKGINLTFSNGATWELTGDSVVNNAVFGKDTVLILKEGSVFEAKETNNVYALNAGNGEDDILDVEQGAKLQIGGIKETTYNIATGFADYTVVEGWTEIADNALLQAELTTTNGLQAVIKAKEASQMATDTGISESTAGLVTEIIQNANNTNNTPEQQAAVEFIQNVVNANGSDSAAVGNAINSATKMGEAGGNSATAASIVKNVTGVTNDRLSFNCGHSAPHKGGHGVGLLEEGSGADIWVEYVHGKDEVEDMPSTAGASSYEGQFNGIVMGVDFKKVNKFQSGIAFNYGEGDTNSVGNAVRTHSDYDFWGVGYYGNIHNDNSNVIFDINYAKTDSDVTQYNSGSTLEASPETTTWSAGVKLEKLYQNENVQIVPYTGLRYMSIDADDYTTKKGEFYYSMDRQDIWLLPLGVSIKQEVTNDNGWTVSPRVDLSYIWAFGDTNSNMEVKSPFAGVSQLGYDVMDDGSFLGLVGIEAHKGQWGYGVAYSYQKGDHSESKKWFVDVNYSF